MKIAILADIHGNHFALFQVLQQARNEQVEKLFILGDIVGYYYHPNKVMELLSEWEYIFIKGNHEELLSKLLAGELDIKMLQDKYGSGHLAAISSLSSIQIERLITSPEKLSIEIDGLKILMCHGSPWDKNLYLYPDTNVEILNMASETGVDIVLIGHSHYQFLHSSKNTILLNPGSVGQSRSTGGLADWAIINTRNKVIQLRSTLYDTTSLITEVVETDPENAYLKNVLTRNRN
jgi:putative phosphoesterase